MLGKCTQALQTLFFHANLSNTNRFEIELHIFRFYQVFIKTKNLTKKNYINSHLVKVSTSIEQNTRCYFVTFSNDLKINDSKAICNLLVISNKERSN